jgi:hypothetical protein
MGMCWHCGTAILDEEPLGRSLRCADCGKDLRCCKACRFFLSGSRGDCSESRAEPVAEKDRGNFCDWFSLNPRYRIPSEGEKKERSSASKAKADFNSLFGS